MTKRFLRALQGECLSPPPVWLMRQAGRYLPEYLETRSQSENFLDFCYSPDLALEVTLQPLRRYDFDAAILFSDILVVPDALGQKVEFIKGKGPKLQPITTQSELESILDTKRFHVYLEPVYEAVRRIAQKIPKTTALIGFAGAPWTVATYMVEGQGSKDYAQVRSIAYQDPEFFQCLIDMLVDMTASYLIEQANHGAEALQVFDSWAGVLSEDQFIRWAIEPMARIVKRIKAVHPNVPVIGFPRGAGALYKRYVQETGIDGVSLDQCVPLEWARDNIQPFATLQGNLDNLLLVTGGEDMEKQVRKIIEILGEGPFIFNLGHGIVPQTSPDNVARLCQIIREKK